MNKYNWKLKRLVNLFFYKIRNRKKIVRALILLLSFVRSFGFLKKRKCDRGVRKAISRKQKVVYLANPKVATRSIFRFIESMDLSDLEITESTVDSLKREEANYSNFFSFTFVRNPWARAYSCWQDKISSTNKFCDIFIITKYKGLYPDMTFEDFINWLGSYEGADEFADRHWLSQYELLKCENDELDITFIGKVEEIDKEFDVVLSALGVAGKMSLTKANTSNTKNENYRDMYTPGMKEVIFKRYRKDIELFNYSF